MCHTHLLLWRKTWSSSNLSFDWIDRALTCKIFNWFETRLCDEVLFVYGIEKYLQVDFKSSNFSCTRDNSGEATLVNGLKVSVLIRSGISLHSTKFIDLSIPKCKPTYFAAAGTVCSCRQWILMKSCPFGEPREGSMQCVFNWGSLQKYQEGWQKKMKESWPRK